MHQALFRTCIQPYATMENPRKEITGVVKGLCSAKDAGQQRDVIQRYFTPDASFDHPLCAVQSYPGVRIRVALINAVA